MMFVIIGLPLWREKNEHRVALTPSGVTAFMKMKSVSGVGKLNGHTHEKKRAHTILTYQSLASVLDGKSVSTS